MSLEVSPSRNVLPSLVSLIGVPHAARGLDPLTKMLTFYEPGGLEHLFEAYEQMDPADFSDPEKMKIIDTKFDSIMLGPKEGTDETTVPAPSLETTKSSI
jgi:hypothetical protein